MDITSASCVFAGGIALLLLEQEAPELVGCCASVTCRWVMTQTTSTPSLILFSLQPPSSWSDSHLLLSANCQHANLWLLQMRLKPPEGRWWLWRSVFAWLNCLQELVSDTHAHESDVHRVKICVMIWCHCWVQVPLCSLAHVWMCFD